MLKKIKLILQGWMTKLEKMIAQAEAEDVIEQKRKRRIRNAKKNRKKNIRSRNQGPCRRAK